MRLPRFFIIGAAKSGTTSLAAMLQNHPDINISSPKEPEFFARDEHYENGIAHYCSLFRDAAPHQICGEASTIYSLLPLFPDVPARIHQHVPDAKLVYIMRAPVKRSYSFYVQLVKNYQNATKSHTIPRSFEEYVFPDQYPDRASKEAVFGSFSQHLPDVPELLLAGSDYLTQIQGYLTYFDRSQMHFAKYEDFARDPVAVMNGILDFLEIEKMTASTGSAVRINVSSDHFDDVRTVAAVQSAKSRLGILYQPRFLPQGLKRRIKAGLKRRVALDSNGPMTPQPMLPQTNAILHDRFSQTFAELEALTGLDLSEWSNRKK